MGKKENKTQAWLFLPVVLVVVAAVNVSCLYVSMAQCVRLDLFVTKQLMKPWLPP